MPTTPAGFPVSMFLHPHQLPPDLLAIAMLWDLHRYEPPRLTFWLTHGQIHALFSHRFARRFPLEHVLAPGRDMEKRLDLRRQEHSWVIDLPTAPNPTRLPAAVTASAPAESESRP